MLLDLLSVTGNKKLSGSWTTKDRSPQSESKCPVERSNSGDIGKNARLAKNGSVQQTSGIQPEVVEHRPVFSGPGAGLIPGTGTGTRYPGPGAPSPAW